MSNYKLLSVGNNAKTVRYDGSEYSSYSVSCPADNLEGGMFVLRAEVAAAKQLAYTLLVVAR